MPLLDIVLNPKKLTWPLFVGKAKKTYHNLCMNTVESVHGDYLDTQFWIKPDTGQRTCPVRQEQILRRQILRRKTGHVVDFAECIGMNDDMIIIII